VYFAVNIVKVVRIILLTLLKCDFLKVFNNGGSVPLDDKSLNLFLGICMRGIGLEKFKYWLQFSNKLVVNFCQEISIL